MVSESETTVGTAVDFQTEQGHEADVVFVSATEAVMETAFKVAVMTDVCAVEIVPAVAVKVADVAEAATKTEAGTVSIVLLLDKATVSPAAGAAALVVTVQVLVAPEASDVGVHVRALTVAATGVRFKEAVLEVLFNVAVTVAV